MERYLELKIADEAVEVSVKLDDEGVVIDLLDAYGEVVGTTWKLYSDFNAEVSFNDIDDGLGE